MAEDRAGLATDRLPRFDLDAWDASYFERIRRRTRQASEHGIYVAIMLFQGYGWQFDRMPDDGFPYDGRNRRAPGRRPGRSTTSSI
jgi:hypothetical protein